jgi:hypothetical protein
MANREHLKKINEGVAEWDRWREKNYSISPDLSSAILKEANLRGANLRGVNLRAIDLSEADLRGAHLGAADLSGAELRGVNLRGADLRGAEVSGADLCEADLTVTDFRRANLDGANLREAELYAADLRQANLSRTDLSGANLGAADFRQTKVTGADFVHSRMFETIFADVDLSQTKGLEAVRHLGPSTIGIDTIQRSKGKIPDVFLRGAGVSDEFIAVIRAMGGAIQFYSCFISYSSKDQLFAERIYEGLQARGVRCWFAPHEMQGGRKLHEQIDDAIRVHERLLLILSPDSINSEWVKTEIAKARRREVIEKRRMLFPVLLKISYDELKQWECFDADTGKDSAREIREYYIPDFSQWERPEKFKEEFEKLVRDLKKAETVPK